MATPKPGRAATGAPILVTMTRRRRPSLAGAGLPPVAPRALVLVLVATVAVCAVWWLGHPRGSAPGSPGRSIVSGLLGAVRVVPERVPAPGYERDCSGPSACVFGPAWSDATTAPGAGNGCPTRHDVLRRDLMGAGTEPDDPCAVDGGILVDPYTGRVLDAGRTGISGIHVDHVYPLAAAWDLGAWRWTAGHRAAFANDVDRNLIAVEGAVNSRKGDATPEDWLPPDPTRHCFYAARYLTAAMAYDLPVTAADRDALDGAVRRCPSGR